MKLTIKKFDEDYYNTDANLSGSGIYRKFVKKQLSRALRIEGQYIAKNYNTGNQLLGD